MIELKDIPGFEGLYAATRDGRIWSHRQKKWMQACGEPDNYQIVMLTRDGYGRCYYVHRLVAMTFLPNPDNLPCVNHKDEHKDNNHVDNLEWCTQGYNLKYSNVGKPCKAVRCIELNTEYPSIYNTAKELGINLSSLSTHLNHGMPKSVGGYHFQFADEPILDEYIV